LRCVSRMRRDRTLHIGEYDTKTNGICGLPQFLRGPDRAD
jgi:hypothetical protein